MVAPLSAIGQVIEAIGMDDSEERKRLCCRRCSIAIRDRFVLKVGKSSYHETCTRCVRCDLLLEEKCFEKGGLLYCEEHYFKECSSFRCAGCNEGVNPRELVYRHTGGIVFHVICHRCVVCTRQLDPGEQISVDANSRTIACAIHYAEPPMMDMGEQGLLLLPPQDDFLSGCSSSSSLPMPPPPLPPMPECMPGPSNEDTHQYMPIDYSAIKQEFPAFFSSFEAFSEYDDESKMLKRRGPRTTIKQNQLDVLNRIFSTTPKPSKHARAKLALETGLSMRVIQVWFQNRRSKERRLKHLCNYLRHYEQRGGMMAGMAAGMGGVFPTGDGGIVDPNSVLSMEGVGKIRESASFYADLDMYDEEDEDSN
ncbi:mec-3 [Pristionchus pacificus]|uniref:Mec-3 n=1 Tax=Pristionchus pacificus TaxID=54126 RepID=A0A2A6C2X2_PRIPA|nr:mec-3 [Pristionchus pacificus]|eukprot:PDM72381.1 mec-3 [Pristionchus pacificus]